MEETVVVDRLKRLRVPIAYVALVGVALKALLSLIVFITYTVQTGISSGVYIATAQPTLGWALLLAVVVGACALWGEPVEGARRLALLAVAGLAVLALLALVLGLIGLVVGPNRAGMAGIAVDALLPGVLAVALYAVAQGLPAPAGRAAVSGPPPMWGGPAQSQSWQQQVPGQQLPGQSYAAQPGPGQPPAPGAPGQPPAPGGPEPYPAQPYGQQSGPAYPQQSWPADPYAQARPQPQAEHSRQPEQPPRQNAPVADQAHHSGQHFSQQSGQLSGQQSGQQTSANQWQQPRSQHDQFGNPGANSGSENPGYSGGTGSQTWQPAVQQPPQRLEPSPDQPPVGPHNQSPAAGSFQPGTDAGEDDHGRQQPDGRSE